jgi:hypothetical protein
VTTGFIYVVRSVGRDYQQPSASAVPTWHNDRLYFGPCKKPMRPRMQVGDYVFGISPSNAFPRRVVFAAKVSKRMSFADAYDQYPALHGPVGPIHVRPATIPGPRFPESNYEHIPDAIHERDWQSDIRTPELDAFFVCAKGVGRLGRWLGRSGPIVQGDLLTFFRRCTVHGSTGLLRETLIYRWCLIQHQQ